MGLTTHMMTSVYNGIQKFPLLHSTTTADNPHNYTFVATTRKSPTDGGFEFFNCEVLACPEWSDLADMLNDTRYDYYTMYANPARKL